MARKYHDDDNYYKPKEGEWVQLSRPPFHNYDACCGCGLVHKFDFKLLPITKGKHKGELTIWRRMYTAKGATNATRRQRSKRKEMKQYGNYFIIAVPILKTPKRKRKSS